MFLPSELSLENDRSIFVCSRPNSNNQFTEFTFKLYKTTTWLFFISLLKKGTHYKTLSVKAA